MAKKVRSYKKKSLNKRHLKVKRTPRKSRKNQRKNQKQRKNQRKYQKHGGGNCGIESQPKACSSVVNVGQYLQPCSYLPLDGPKHHIKNM